jgi:hypothetical protein
MMVQSRFHKGDDGDLHEQILRIEAHIEELADVVESCRKIILVSKFAAGAGGILAELHLMFSGRKLKGGDIETMGNSPGSRCSELAGQ